MKNIKSKVVEFLKEDEWVFEEMDEKVIRTGMKGENSNYYLFFLCEEDKQQLVLIGFQETPIPEPYRLQAAELLTRANLGLSVGSFIMDLSRGNYRFRIGYNLEDGTLSSAMLRNSIAIIYKMLDDMYPCIMKLIYGENDVEDIYEQWVNT